MIVAPSDPLPLQFQKNPIDASKWPTVDQYIVYFKISPIHAPVDVIRHRFEQVVNEKGVVGFIHWYPS